MIGLISFLAPLILGQAPVVPATEVSLLFAGDALQHKAQIQSAKQILKEKSITNKELPKPVWQHYLCMQPDGLLPFLYPHPIIFAYLCGTKEMKK